MGKGILIMILGMGIILSILEISLNSNTSQGLSSTVKYYDNMEARLISNSGIEIYLEKMRLDKTITGAYTNNSLMGGRYDIYISGPDTALKLKSIGTFDGVSHTSMILAKRAQVTLPKVNASVYVAANTLGINFGGNLKIDGNDNNMDGTKGTGTALPGIAVSIASDSVSIVNDIKSKTAGNITGAGGTPSVRTVPDVTDWNSVSQNIVAGADYTIASGTVSGGSYGTASAPKVTYATGDVHFSGTVTGYGIMVVNGNLTMSGQFTFNGILLVYGSSQISVQSTGQATIYGATMLVGQHVDFQPASGKAAFYYSSQAINNAQINLKSTQYKILSWWE